MAEFSSFVIQPKGHALMSKLIAGSGTCNFSAIRTSTTVYTQGQLESGLTSLTNIKQSTEISSISRINNTSVNIKGALNNKDLVTGYTVNTIGLYAIDHDEGEILYAVARAIHAGYMPPYNGITSSGILFDFVITVGNAENVTVIVNPAAVATQADVIDINAKIADLAGYVGYTDDDIVGVEVDYANRTFTRLAGAVGKTPGADFDNILAFGGRRRCNVTDEGQVIAYYGDPGYTETGKLTQEIIIGEDESALSYPVGTHVQVMVEQPRFYYKVVPLKLDRVTNGKGFHLSFHLRKARYYVSDTKLEGFKVHPAFIQDGVERPFIYLSAYEASVFDTSAEEYLLADEQIVDFTAGSGDKLASIAYAKPTSGATQLGATRNGFRKLAANRGEGWSQAYAATVSATQLLLIIEYGTMNSQTAIGKGIVDKPSGDEGVNYAEVTGATTNLGNTSGMVEGTNGLVSVTYRGEENFWGNIWAWVDGLNIYNQSDLYVADHDFVDDSSAEPYKDAGITLAKTSGYISAFGYNEEFDWLFFPSETTGSSALPVGDNFYQISILNVWMVTRLGGSWGNSLYAGAFYWGVVNYSWNCHRFIGGRLVYVPPVA